MKDKEYELADNYDLHDQYLGFLDLEQHPEWAEAWKNQDETKVNEILFSLGVDLNYGWEIDIVMHRSRSTNQVDYGPRFSFKERTDAYWMKNNMALEDVIRNTSDPSFRAEMLGMSQRYNLGRVGEKLKSEIGDVDE